LNEIGTTSRTRWLRCGVSFFIVGLVEKIVVADSLAAFVDPAFASYASLSSLGAWLACIGYSFQLYFDFAGYSDMAVGLGYLFGLRIPQNFNSPYKALDPSDFWRRWHISLSTCLRDYLYVPLGGNRRGELFTYRNLLLTMLIGGLWHGANWTFVVWGAYHGVLLALYRRFSTTWDTIPAMLRQLMMFVLVMVGWVVFRSTDFGMAWTLLKKMALPAPGATVAGVPAFVILALIAAVWSMLGPNAFDVGARWQFKRRHAFALAAAFGACVTLMAGGRSSPFLYFQF